MHVFRACYIEVAVTVVISNKAVSVSFSLSFTVGLKLVLGLKVAVTLNPTVGRNLSFAFLRSKVAPKWEKG